MADETTPIETSATETTQANDAPAGTTALGGAVDAGSTSDAPVVEAANPEAPAADAEAKADDRPAVPDTYELTPPEGMTIAAADLEAATPVFKELGLSNETASKLLPVAAKFAERIQAEANKALLDNVAVQRNAWLTEAKADPEIGGANWDKSITTAAKALDGLGFVKGSPLRNLLDESGLGNHPDMIRAWTKVGKAIGEDNSFERGTSGTGKKSDAELFYPSATTTA